ncbi:hypothetical protein Vretimale_6476 [Volvox reticuliferus]|uniref:Ubiquitin thioesterase OTU n=1 Tax=Volvox reticuliferus TaxID=1737510 RepID=A0A8J4FWU7_9CHLO|nr:hypothetical protein Vretifemale_19966 [Volvox reticuliferus]GIM01676.1 hypothetical protein Vretimale_6476 [Volvox reticuliferus]
MSLTLRCRGPNGQCTLSGVDTGMSIQAFLEMLSEKTGVSSGVIEILTGFPPKAIQVPQDGTVFSLALANGDTLTVRQSSTATTTATATAPQAAPSGSAVGAVSTSGTHTQDVPQGSADSTAATLYGDLPYVDEDEMLARAIAASLEGAAAPAAGPIALPAGRSSQQQLQQRRGPEEGEVSARTVSNAPAGGGPAPQSVLVPGGDGSCVVRRVIDSDNSCLFNAVGYVMERSRTKADDLRKVVAQVVASDPVTFNDSFLGKEVNEYCSWIQQKNNWGGAIELFILAQHYGREIAAFDIQTKRCDVYGQDKGYEDRALLIYDGLHYDAMAVAAFEGASEELDVTMFCPRCRDGEAIMAAAEELVAAAHAARQFSDTANFRLRCGVCQIGLKGEKEAVEHAKATGHSNFAEF